MRNRPYLKTKYEGVFYRESSAQNPGALPDRTYAVCYRDAAGKLCWQTVGRHSSGVRAAYASQVRKQLLLEVAQGKNPALKRTFTVGDAVKAYLLWAEAEGKNTLQDKNRYDHHLKDVLDALPITAVSLDILTRLKRRMSKRLSAQSIRHSFGFVRKSVNHAIATLGLQIPNPFSVSRGSPFQLPKADNSAVRFLSPEEARLLLEELNRRRSRQIHDMALLSLKTGMRSTEIFSIKGQGIDRAAGLIHFMGKSKKPEFVHAGEDILAMLKAYGRKPGEYVFQSREGGPITNGISETFNRAVDKLRLNEGVTDNRRKVVFHTFRHTYASWLAQSGKVTLQELKELMRHERIEMTLRYAHLIPGHQRNGLRIIDEILGGAHG